MQQTLSKKILQSKSFLLLAITAVVLLITYIVSPGAFNVGNAKQILSNISYVGIFAVGVACLLISGGIDFSLSGQATFAMIMFAQILKSFPSLPWGVAVLAALVYGVIAGSINAFFANGLKLMSFICTIGMSSVWTGLATWYTRGNIIPIRNASFSALSATYIGNTPIPMLFIFMALVVAGYSFMLRRTRFGRSILMAGGNPAAARLAGMNTGKIKSILFVNASVLAVVGGLIWASQQNVGSPAGLLTVMPEMTGLTASILGGVSFMGGSGSLGGAFSGVLLINVLAYALQVMGLPTWLITFINGSLLVVALTIDGYNMRRRFRHFGIKGGGGGGGMVMPGMSK
ncbi:MAG: ABC transporter permease [Oscillospiraceae bacterium]|jgi:ribose/xylose/arabinose/galactoside ABC-type transport system permease subunit|nr:ABC transporter permease [Oscillospiraceae bacterium]